MPPVRGAAKNPANKVRRQTQGVLRVNIMRPTRPLREQPSGGACFIVLAALVALSGCSVHRQTPGEVTTSRLRQMHGALLEFRARQGQLPDSLELVCRRDARLCELKSADSWKLDGWGRPFGYSHSDGEFDLRSAGADGLARTVDDMEISSRIERRLVRAVAGCYLTTTSWWKHLRGNMIQLDTVPRGSGYILLPDAGDYVGRWVPEGVEAVRLAWIRGDQSMTLRLRHHADSLVGRRVANGRLLVGVKTSCAERVLR